MLYTPIALFKPETDLFVRQIQESKSYREDAKREHECSSDLRPIDAVLHG